MPREQVERLAQKNAITRAVGVYEHVEPETLVLDVTIGDRFLLCSDGLCGYFEEDLSGLSRRLGTPDADAAANAHGSQSSFVSPPVDCDSTDARCLLDFLQAQKLLGLLRRYIHR